MTDVSNLDNLAAAISSASGSAKIKAYAVAQAAATQAQEAELQEKIAALDVRLDALEATAPSTYLLNEDFDSLQIPSIWQPVHQGGSDTSSSFSSAENQVYRQSQLTVANSILTITATTADGTDVQGNLRNYTSGMIQSGGVTWPSLVPAGFTFTYGLIEMRAKMPTGAGLWPALWLCNAEPTEYCSHEIDCLEWLGSQPTLAQYNYHYNGSVVSSGAYTHSESLSNAFHVYAVEWRPTYIRWLFDGVEKQRFTSSTQISDRPHYIICNLTVTGATGWGGPPDGNTVFPQSFLVDYIRVSP